MRCRLSDRKLARIQRETGNPYISAWYRGGNGPWLLCFLPATEARAASAHWVNRLTWETRKTELGFPKS